MANELSLTLSLTCFKPAVMANPVSRSWTGLVFTMTGNYVSQGSINVPITATALPVLSLSTQPHLLVLQNKDATNYLTIRNGSGGADVVQLLAGEVGLIPLLSSGTFFWLANTAPVEVDYLLLSL